MAGAVVCSSDAFAQARVTDGKNASHEGDSFQGFWGGGKGSIAGNFWDRGEGLLRSALARLKSPRRRNIGSVR